jgi:hypothetical protein
VTPGTRATTPRTRPRRGLSGAARSSYELLLRFRFAGDALPPSDRDLREEEYAGLLLSVALRLGGVTEGSGRFLSREGSNIWVKTTEGRQGLPVDPEVPMARRIGDLFYPASTLELRPGDRLRWLKNGSRLLALWVEMDPDGPTFERESAWTEWVRRVPARELARRMSGRVAGTEVREIEITKRSPTGRAIEMRVKTDLAEATSSASSLARRSRCRRCCFRLESRGTRLRGRVRLSGTGLGPRRRPVPERLVRDGPGRRDLRRDPAPLLHGHRDPPGNRGHGVHGASTREQPNRGRFRISA